MPSCAAPNLPVNLDVDVGAVDLDLIPVGCANAGCTGEELENFEPSSLIASPTAPDRINYAFTRSEGATTFLDVR